jgi:cell division transport system permease protein
LVIAIALALPAALWIGVTSLKQLSGTWQNSSRISVFVDGGLSEENLVSLENSLRKIPLVKDVAHISPEAALAEFQAASGFGEALKLLDYNPLPPVFLLSPDPGLTVNSDELSVLLDRVNKLPGVDQVQLDMLWLQRMRAILEISWRVALLMGFALALGVLLVVGNTIRLAIENRRDEILVLKLVGGTSGFVRRPFLYTGFWYGLFGGLIAWVGVVSGCMWLNSNVAHLGSLYHSEFVLVGLGMTGLIFLVTVGSGLGLAAAALATGRYLTVIEPQ